MSDPTAYHRKLAEAMDTAIDKAFVEHDFVDVIATVLAAEQVVDPEDHRDVVGELQAEQEAHRYVLDVRDELEQQLAALRAELEDKNHTRLDQLEIDTAKTAERIDKAIRERIECEQQLATERMNKSATIALFQQRLAALRAKLAEAERLLNCLPFRPGVNRDRVIAALRAGDNDG